MTTSPSIAGRIVEGELERDQPSLGMTEKEHRQAGIAPAHLLEGGADVGHVVVDVVDVHAPPLAPAVAAVVHGMHGEARVVEGGGGRP